MDAITEQPEAGSGPEERLVQFFAKSDTPEEPEAAPEAEAQPEEVESEAEAEPDSQDIEVQDLVDIEIDGETFKAPPKVRDAVMAQTKFTREMQALSATRKQVEDKAMFVEAREKVFNDILADASDLRSKQAELERLNAIDFNALSGLETTQALALFDRKASLQREVGEMQQRLQQRSAHAQQMAQQHRSQQWQMAVEGAKQLLGSYTAADDAAAAAYIKQLGMSQDEAMQLLAHPKLLVMAFHAAKHQQAQSGIGQAKQKAAKAPPVIKPGASQGQGASQQNKYLQARQALKKSGDPKDAARLFMLKGF